MTDANSWVGLASETEVFEVEKGAIRAFARAIGDDNPLYHDETFARQHGYRSIVAPPTFPTTLRVSIALDFDASRSLHGAQEYGYTRPIVAGDVLHCRGCVSEVYERQGSSGKLTFVVIEEWGKDSLGQPVYTVKKTLILR